MPTLPIFYITRKLDSQWVASSIPNEVTFDCWILFVLRKKASDVNIAKFVYFEKTPNGNLFPKTVDITVWTLLRFFEKTHVAITNTECHGFIFSQKYINFFSLYNLFN